MPNAVVRAFLRSAAALGLAALSLATHADVLDNVTKAGVLRVAIMTDYPPFGSVDAEMKPRGYDIDMCALLEKAWGLKIVFVPVTAPNRIPTLQSGKADVLLNVGRTDERAKVVDFTQPYAPYYIGIYGSAGGAPFKNLGDLKGKSLAVTRGAIEDVLLSKSAPDTAISRYEDNASTIAAFMSGQRELIAIGNIVALSLQEKGTPRKFEEKLIVLNSPVHAAVSKGESRLLEKMNGFLSSLKQNGQLDTISQKWLKQPLASNLR
jgi:polar amino acid transport system substrate-binding protein